MRLALKKSTVLFDRSTQWPKPGWTRGLWSGSLIRVNLIPQLIFRVGLSEEGLPPAEARRDNIEGLENGSLVCQLVAEHFWATHRIETIVKASEPDWFLHADVKLFGRGKKLLATLHVGVNVGGDPYNMYFSVN